MTIHRGYKVPGKFRVFSRGDYSIESTYYPGTCVQYPHREHVHFHFTAPEISQGVTDQHYTRPGRIVYCLCLCRGWTIAHLFQSRWLGLGRLCCQGPPISLRLCGNFDQIGPGDRLPTCRKKRDRKGKWEFSLGWLRGQWVCKARFRIFNWR